MKLLVPLVAVIFAATLAFFFVFDDDDDAGPGPAQDEARAIGGGMVVDLDRPARPSAREAGVADEGAVEAPAAARAEAGGDAEPLVEHRRLSAIALSPAAAPGDRRRAREALRALAPRVFAGPRSILPVDVVEVARGDNLTRIAQRIGKAHGVDVTPAMIMRFNGKPSDVLRIGERLAVPLGDPEIVVLKSDYALMLTLGGHVVLDLPVGLGRDDSTPVGDFVIRGKTVDPDWTTPEGELIRFGEPGHLIGTRWMGFDDASGRTGYGIHGTIDESTIGTQSSDGCIRLAREAVEELFRLVPEGAPVKVRA